MHLNSYLLFKKYASLYFKPDNKVLEIGVNGRSEYHDLIKPTPGNWQSLNLTGIKSANGWEYHIETKNEYSFPVDTDSYDVVLSGQVIEHVRDIYLWMEELYRITRPGGIVITINPVSWPYHEAPVDCWRIYPDGMKALAERIGFNIMLSKFESLELEYFGYPDKFVKIPNCIVPGISIADDAFSIYRINRMKLKLNGVLTHVPFLRAFMPGVKIAYDTITILQKPARG